MKMHFLSGGRLRMRQSIFYPDAPRGEMFELPVISTLLRHAQGNVLFDTGCHPDAATDAQGRWGGVAKVMTPIFAPEDTVVAQLGGLGLGADDIDVVVCSHLHPDHCGCNQYFRRATIYCHAAEVAAVRAEGSVNQGYIAKDWDQPQGFSTFEQETDLFGDGRIVLLPFPGHTPGLTTALVRLDESGPFLLASDALPLEAHLISGQAPKNTWDMDKANRSIAAIREIGERGATVIFGHDDAQWRRLRRGAEFYA